MEYPGAHSLVHQAVLTALPFHLHSQQCLRQSRFVNCRGLDQLGRETAEAAADGADWDTKAVQQGLLNNPWWATRLGMLEKVEEVEKVERAEIVRQALGYPSATGEIEEGVVEAEEIDGAGGVEWVDEVEGADKAEEAEKVAAVDEAVGFAGVERLGQAVDTEKVEEVDGLDEVVVVAEDEKDDAVVEAGLALVMLRLE